MNEAPEPRLLLSILGLVGSPLLLPPSMLLLECRGGGGGGGTIEDRLVAVLLLSTLITDGGLPGCCLTEGLRLSGGLGFGNVGVDWRGA